MRAVVGETRQRPRRARMRDIVDRNRRLMRMHADLPMPDLDSARLPLDRLVMRRALAARGINLGPSLWALTGGAPAAHRGGLALVPQPWVWRTRSACQRGPAPGQLALF